MHLFFVNLIHANLLMRIAIIFIFSLTLTVAYAQQHTFVFLNSRTDKQELPKEELDELMKGHMANMERLANEGKLIAAGPFEGGGGIFIFKSTSIAQTNEWIRTDPGIKANRWNVEVFPFYLKQGSICTVHEPYEMVAYNFIRFIPQITKFTAPTYPEIFKRHDEYLLELSKTGNTLLNGNFGTHEGGVLIMKGALQREVVENDPGVREILMEFDLKKLWIAKGSFCEK
jgi:uncharacterized protein YciI